MENDADADTDADTNDCATTQRQGLKWLLECFPKVLEELERLPPKRYVPHETTLLNAPIPDIGM